MPNNDSQRRDANLMTIAREQLQLETLETRLSDGLDFHDMSVSHIKAALEAAYEAGRAERTPKR